MREQDDEIINHIREQIVGVDEGLIPPDSAIRTIAALTETILEKKQARKLRILKVEEFGKLRYTITQQVPGGYSTMSANATIGEDIDI